MSVQERQEKLMDKLNLNGLSEWSPHNAAIDRELLFSYHDIFVFKPDELGCTSTIKHEIHLNDDEPFKERFRHIPPPLLEKVHASLRDILEAGAIQPSQSLWCNAVVLVWKKDGSLWFCIDFRCLNMQTKKDSYPSPGYKKHWRAWPELHTSPPWIPRVDFGQSTWPWSCNSILHSQLATLVSMNLPGCPLDCVTHSWHSSIWCRIHWESSIWHCIIYLDGMIILGCTEEEHLKRLWVVFEHFREFNLKQKPSKCSFIQTEIVYLAHHISSKGICPSEENVCAIVEFPMSETYTEVRAFCGLADHYHHFIRNFAWLVHALYDILGDEVKMGPVILTPKAEEAVWLLKEKILSVPVLVFPDFSEPFLLETDASKEGLGVVLPQKQDDGCYHPVVFGSRTLTPSEQNYHSSKLEFLALKWSVTEHFKEHLVYTPFTVHMDSNPLMYMLTTPKFGHDRTSLGWGTDILLNSHWNIRKDQTMPPLMHWAEYLSDMTRIL